MDPISYATPPWFYNPPPAPAPVAEGNSSSEDSVQLSQPQREMETIDQLRNFARANGPLPSQVPLPQLAFAPVPLKPAFRGRAPLPSKLDLHSVLSGEKVAAAARRYNQTPIQDLTGQLPHFQDTRSWPETNYGTNNQCANFVSSFAQRLGLRGHYMRVADLEAALAKQGWKSVTYKDAKPGDVWISDTHTELVTGRQAGLPLVTGSNNGGHSYQTVSTHAQRSGRFYTRPIWRKLQ